MLLNEFIVASDDAWSQQQEEREKRSKSYTPTDGLLTVQGHLFEAVSPQPRSPQFLKKFFSIKNLHIEQGVSNAEKRVRRFRHDFFCERRDGRWLHWHTELSRWRVMEEN